MGVVASLAADVVVFEMTPPLALPPGGARDVEGFAAWLEGFEEIDVEVRDLGIEAEGRARLRAFAASFEGRSHRRAEGKLVDALDPVLPPRGG